MSSTSSNAKAASIFLHGTYPQEHRGFYREAIERARGKRRLIAADGGLLLFDELGLAPDIIIGDFDSVGEELLGNYKQSEIIRHPSEKNESDGELALRRAVDLGCSDIEIYGAVDTRFESEHLLANLMLLKLARLIWSPALGKLSVRAVDHCQSIYFIEDESLELEGTPGEYVSVIPISESIALTIKGVQWELDGEEVRMGSSLPLHNRLTSPKVAVYNRGMAFLIHRRG